MNTYAAPDALTCRESAHNLHINVGQTLGMAQAEGIMQLLASRKDSCKKFFIDVRQVTSLDREAAGSLRAALPQSPVGMQRIAFKGRLGFDLAVGGNKVLIVPDNAKHVCRGTCPDCKCGHKKARARARNAAKEAIAAHGANGEGLQQ
ncbi:squalene cyclase [uncultured Desulfovibrio sp.]|uniref:squalene cyclase n=1 Tax=uncultured Desulfovibrio sp. TaxID=167968 RepID=UPI002602428E|nr:squalene cyclase [uncultured Desulfovibrio sp.]